MANRATMTASFIKKHDWIIGMGGWGRYSGFFFYSYPGKRLWGPFPDREAANDKAADLWENQYLKNGAIFQIEKPVYIQRRDARWR